MPQQNKRHFTSYYKFCPFGEVHKNIYKAILILKKLEKLFVPYKKQFILMRNKLDFFVSI